MKTQIAVRFHNAPAFHARVKTAHGRPLSIMFLARLLSALLGKRGCV
jgi:hypothetical protein